MKCEYCGYEFNAKFCPNCGAASPEMQINNAPAQWQQPVDNSNMYQGDGNDYYRYRNQPIYKQYNSGVKPRSITACIILSILTCRLYNIYWFGSINDEINYLSDEKNPTSGGFAVLLLIITCKIYYFYWAYKQGERIDRTCALRDMPPKKSGVLYLLLLFVPYVGSTISLSLMQNEINNLA